MISAANCLRAFWKSGLVAALLAAATLSGMAQIAGPGRAPKPKKFEPVVQHTEAGVAYVTTGIGFDSRSNLPSFSTKVIFATRRSSYLANIDAEITPGPKGPPTRIHSSGPWLLVDLAPGAYSIRAVTSKGHVVTRRFVVSRGRTTEIKLVWDLSDDEI
jgi:hypothetical protein